MHLDDSQISLDQLSLDQIRIPDHKLSSTKPKYNIQKSVGDIFYINFFNCLQQIKGYQEAKYKHMRQRLEKYFGFKQIFQLGYRFRKRIEPSYQPYIDSDGIKRKVYPLPNVIVCYGIDFLSNKQIMQMFNVKKQFIKRVNMSNIFIEFQNKEEAKKNLQPYVESYFIEKKQISFFQIKKEEIQGETEKNIQEEEEIHQNFPRGWFSTISYQYSTQKIPWAIRYSTNRQYEQIPYIRQQQDFLIVYETAKHIFKQKAKQKQMILAEQKLQQEKLRLRSKKFGSNYNSQATSEFNYNQTQSQNQYTMSENHKESRQRSRQKNMSFKKKSTSSQNQQVLELGQVLIDLQNDQYEPIREQSNESDLSVINNGQNDSWLDVQKVKTQHSDMENIESFMNNLQLNDDSMTIQELRKQQENDFSRQNYQDMDELDCTNSFYSKLGNNDSILFQKQTQKQKLMRLNPPTKKFNYNEYIQNSMNIQYQQKQFKKKNEIIIIND